MAWAGLRRGFSRAGPSPQFHAVPFLQQRPRPPTATPRPESRGPQLSPRVPGRSAPRASRTHPAPRSGLRRRTSSRAGDAAAGWWTEQGEAGDPGEDSRRRLRARPGAGQEAAPNPG